MRQSKGIVTFVLAFTTAFTPLLQADQNITIKGSDTMVNLGQAWAESFMADRPDVLIAVTGGGSGTGIAALISNTTSIAQSSRKMTEKEFEQARAGGHEIKEIPTAIDALVVVVHPSNSVKELTIDQLSGIFSGKITNWKEVGGIDKAILVLSRERNSGTHVFFLEEVVRRGNPKGPEEFAPSVLMMSSSQAIVQEVSDNAAAISYFGHGYLAPSTRSIAIAKKAGDPFVSPSIEAALDGSYALSRPLYFYIPESRESELKEFLTFVLSEKGQAIVSEMGFIPYKEILPAASS